MSLDAQENEVLVTPADRVLLGLGAFVSANPLVAGVVAGIFAGGISDSGLMFFATLIVIFLLGLHLQARRDA